MLYMLLVFIYFSYRTKFFSIANLSLVFDVFQTLGTILYSSCTENNLFECQLQNTVISRFSWGQFTSVYPQGLVINTCILGL